MLSCPKCKSDLSTVWDSKYVYNKTLQISYFRRKRICKACDSKYTTYEVRDIYLKGVIKPRRK